MKTTQSVELYLHRYEDVVSYSIMKPNNFVFWCLIS